MAQSVVTRTQRRIERKQAYWILALVVGVALASFALGFALGRRGDRLPGLAKGSERPTLPVATQVAPPPPPDQEPAVEPQKLTFYDNLPKGSQAPLGSGINLPPKQDAPVNEEKVPAVSEAPAPKPTPAPSKPPAEAKVPAEGAFVVQAASFRTEDDARKLAAKLQKLRMEAFVERADLGAKGVWYRVLAGPYADRLAADQAAGRLQSEERLSVLVRRR